MTADKHAVLFLSTGRCGTQSIAKVLQQLCNDYAVVEHEPIEFGYKPNLYFRCDPDYFAKNKNEQVCDHLETIKETLESRIYIETGWPCYSHIPFFIQALNNKARVIHLIRHPVKVAASLTTHDFYEPANSNGFNVYGALSPYIEGTVLKEYKTRWEEMSRFEKCLYHWAEINLYGLWLQVTYRNIPFLRIKAEKLFENPEGMYRQIMKFIGIPWKKDISKEIHRVDNYARQTREPISPELLLQHPEIIRVMNEFSYSGSSITGESITRYIKENRFKTLMKKITGR